MDVALSKGEVLRRLLPDDTGMEELYPLLEERQYEPGYRIVVEGDAVDKTMHLIAAGEVEITRDPFLSGNPQLIDVLRPGDVVGEMAIVQDRPRSATATARTDVVTYALTGDNWAYISAFYPGLAARIQEIAAGRRPDSSPPDELTALTTDLEELARECGIEVPEGASARDIIAALRLMRTSQK